MQNASLSSRIERRLHNILWAREPLGWDLKSGLKLEVANPAEWILYGEIFVEGEYDFAINRALEVAGSDTPLNVVDLGANVGFFAMRLIDRILRDQGPDFPFTAILVEGSPACAAELRRRVERDPAVRSRVRVEHGLAGLRSGAAKIYEHAFHAANSVNNPVMAREGKGTEVKFVDLMALTRDMQRIHLLKCDIEGSELQMLESYPDLLAKVDTMVMELHPALCDVARCRQLLADAGLARRTVIRGDMPEQLVEHFDRG